MATRLLQGATSVRAEAAVIVPWDGDAPDLLIAQLQCLIEQDIDADLAIRVAANSARALRNKGAVQAMSTDRREIRIVDASNRAGASYARNVGAYSTDSQYLLFCDADDEVDVGWAHSMVTALCVVGGVVGGRISYERLNEVPFALSRGDALPVAFGFLPFTPSASLGLSRDLFDALGGFDETLTSGEDIDLCWRAHYAGASISQAPGARIDYRLRQSIAGLWRQGYRYGRNDVQLFRQHRSRGMRRTARDTAQEMMRLLALLALAPLARRHRLKAVLKLGTVVGHLSASMNLRTYFI